MKLQLRSLFKIDFSCALAAAGIYFLLFDFLTENLNLPYWLVQTQLSANFLYGIYGLVLFATRKRKPVFYKFLIIMNFIYAAFCRAIGLLILKDTKTGALLLVAEGFFIAALATVEWMSLRNAKAFP